MKELCILNIYQLDIYNVLNVMISVKKKHLIHEAFKESSNFFYKISTQKAVSVTLKDPRFNLEITKFAISLHGAPLRNKLLDKNTKAIKSFSFFRRTKRISPKCFKHLSVQDSQTSQYVPLGSFKSKSNIKRK